MNIVRWKPKSDLLDIDKTFTNFFDDLFSTRAIAEKSWTPRLDVYEEKDRVNIEAEIPGLQKEDIKVKLEDNVLNISGERKEEEEKKGKGYYRMERRYGKFFRSVALPVEVKEKDIKANYKDGVLKIEIPKAEEEKGKEVEIKVE